MYGRHSYPAEDIKAGLACIILSATTGEAAAIIGGGIFGLFIISMSIHEGVTTGEWKKEK